MSAASDVIALWGGTPLTKFRIPRIRRDVIARPRLNARLWDKLDCVSHGQAADVFRKHAG